MHTKEDGSVALVAAVPSLLWYEGLEDVEDALHQVLGDSVFDLLEKGSETFPSRHRATGAELLESLFRGEAMPAHLRESSERTSPSGPENRELICSILNDLIERRTLDKADLAEKHECSELDVDTAAASIEDWNLAGLPAAGSDWEFFLTRAGKQFIDSGGRVPVDTVRFLPNYVDDLYAREALRLGGHVLLDDLTSARSEEMVLDCVECLVPPAFSSVVDRRLAYRFIGAAGSLMARLSNEEPAGCVAEEILAVGLIENAKVLIEVWDGVLSDDEVESAKNELRGIFELFGDDDVLRMFEWLEPADASVELNSPISDQLGIADQRPEAWFIPFGTAISTGTLTESRAFDWPPGGWEAK